VLRIALQRIEVSVFTGKTLLITGGTGSFGNAVLRRFLQSGIGEIRIFSRDEKKQDDMRKAYAHPRLKFHLGDVRDRTSVAAAMHGVDYVFHAAALKQVPSCEFYPMQAVRTNVMGTENVLNAAREHGVGRVICLSTDKAVYPINAMGISKAMMEKVMVATSRTFEGTGTVACGTRYGNVMASRGSVIPLFVNQVLAGKPITVTDPQMTRFMMTLEDAVELVLFAFEHGQNGDIFVQKSPAATIEVLIKAILDLIGRPDHPVVSQGGYNDNRHPAHRRTDADQAFQNGDIRQVQVKHHDIGHRPPVKPGTGGFQTVGRVDGPQSGDGTQRHRQSIAEQWMVIHDQSGFKRPDVLHG
jgi:UDP-glucose 4-epimerase